VYSLRALETHEIGLLLKRALGIPDRGLGHLGLKIADELVDEIAVDSSGDARSALNTLEIAAGLARDGVIDGQVLAHLETFTDFTAFLSCLAPEVESE